MCCVAGIFLWCIRRITCTIATIKGCLAKCTCILLCPAICFLCSILKFMRKRSRCFPSLKNAFQFLLFVFVSSIPLLLLLTDAQIPCSSQCSLGWGEPRCSGCSLCSIGGICHQGTVPSHFQFWSEILPPFLLLQKISRPLEKLHFVQVAFGWAKYFARPAGTVCFCKRIQCFSFVLNAFLNILGLVYRERLYHVMVG